MWQATGPPDSYMAHPSPSVPAPTAAQWGNAAALFHHTCMLAACSLSGNEWVGPPQKHTLGYFILLDLAGHAVLSCLSPVP